MVSHTVLAIVKDGKNVQGRGSVCRQNHRGG
jgi:hypothetical protein